MDKIIIDVELKTGTAKKRADELAVAIEKQKLERRELLKTQKEVVKEFGKESEQARKVAIQLNDNSNVTKALRREINVLNRVVRSGADSLDDQRANLARLNLAYDKFRVGVDGTEEDLQKLRSEIQELDKAIKGSEQSTGRFQRQVGDYSQAFKQAFSGNAPVIGNFTKLLGGPAAIVTGLVAGIGALGSKLFEMSQNVAQARLQVESLTAASGDYALEVASQAQAIEETYGTTLSETLTAANTLTRELGGSIAENTEALGNAAALTGDKFDEVLDIVKEYPSQFRNLNLSAKDFLAIATTQVKEGIYSDKGVDALKEGLINLRELPKATTEGLAAIGFSGEEIQERIKSGSTTLFTELQTISGEISKLDPQSAEARKAIAGIFGEAGQDAGQRYFEVLSQVKGGFDELNEGATESQKLLIQQQEAAASLNRSFNFLLGTSGQFIEEAKTGFKQLLAEGLVAAVDGVEKLINGFVELYNNSIVVRGIFNLFFANVQTGIDIAIAGFKRLVNSVSTIGQVIKSALTGNFSDIPDIIRDGFAEGREIGRQLGEDIGNNYSDALESTLNGRLEKVDLIPDNIPEQVGTIGSAIDQLRAKIQQLEAEKLTLGVNDKDGLAAINKEIQATKKELNDLLGLSEKLGDEERLAKELTSRVNIEDQKLQILAESALRQQDILNTFLEEQIVTATEKQNELIANAEEGLDGFNLKVQEQAEAATQAELDRIARVQEARTQQIDSEIELNAEKRKAISDTAAIAIKLFGEESKAGQAAIIIQKVLAATEVGLQLQKELAAIAVASAAISASAPPVTIPTGIAYGKAKSTGAIIRAGISLAKIAAFEDGGLTYDGRPVKMIDSHASGGWRRQPTLGLIGEKGPEFVLSNKMLQIPQVAAMVSQLEGSHIRPFADGGFSSSVINNQVLNLDLEQAVGRAMGKMPRQVVVIEEIEAKGQQLVEVRGAGDF